jgi:hypothetical protein
MGIHEIKLSLYRLLLRRAMMMYTRDVNINTREDFVRSLKTAQKAAFLFAAMGEQECQAVPSAKLDDFPFTQKLHWLIAHLMAQCMLKGHPRFGNDLWVERMLRSPACRESRCVIDM